MPRPATLPFDQSVVSRITAMGDDAPSPEDKLQLMQQLRELWPEAGAELDHAMLRLAYHLHAGVEDARQSQAALKALLGKLTAPPWHPAVYVGEGAANGGPTAVVVHGSSRRVVHVIEDLSPATLAPGDEVLLSHDLNVIVSRSTTPVFHCGDVATFDRRTPDGRLVVNARDEEVVVDASALLAQAPLRSGDLVRWDRTVGMAFEVIGRSAGTGLFLEEAPSDTFADVGGLDSQIAELERAVLLRFHHGDLVARYGLRPKRSVLLWGPPGTGKTMMARALANRVRELSPSGRSRFMSIKPGALHSMWYAQSERNYREVFRIARDAGERDPDIPVILYFDEVDAIGSTRGASVTRVDDRVLTAFMAELDGLESRGNVMVVASTNRRDALDPGLTRPGRLGDCVIHVPAPGRKAARAILAKHLGETIPYAQNGHGTDAASTREEILDAVVARLYAPNAAGDVATLMFRDGKRHTVRARDLVSGAVLAKVAMAATERACVRELATGEPGVRLEDVAGAMDDEMASASRVLTPANCRAYLTDLPQDVDVVSVSPIVRPRRPGTGLVYRPS